MTRILNESYRQKVMSAQEAAALIKNGDTIGFSGFTGAGYPKDFPLALAERAKQLHQAGEEFRVNVYTGASTAPELDGALAEAGAVGYRMPYQSDPETRRRINSGDIDYTDIHLSHSALQLRQGFLGSLDYAVVEVAAIKEDGSAVPSSSVGNNAVYLERAEKVILEVNSWQSLDLEGMHDVYRNVQLPPHRLPLPLTGAGDRIGEPTYHIDPAKVVAVVECERPDRNTPFKAPDAISEAIAGYYIDFLSAEVKRGTLPASLLPLQSGVGNVANAVLAGLKDGPFNDLVSFTEVIQDGMVDLIDAGKMSVASATAFSLSPEYAAKMNDNAASYRKSIVLRQQEVSNHPELIRRLGVLACNGMIEADIYGNVNSTHIMGSKMQNGIGGSGDFARNAYISAFVTPSVAKGGAISAIVPMVSHVDHTEHDVAVIITEQGLADLRGVAPRKRARLVIEKCAHPDYRPLLLDYLERAEKSGNGLHTPHLLNEAHAFHIRFLESGTMKP